MTSHKNRRDCDVGRRDTAACPRNLLNSKRSPCLLATSRVFRRIHRFDRMMMEL